MDDENIKSVAELKALVKLENGVKFVSEDREQTYQWIGRTLGKFRYFGETKRNKCIIKNYLIMMSGYSESQIDKLIKRKKETGRVFVMERTQNTFVKFYGVEDIVLLAEIGAAYEYQNANALRKVFYDMYHIYGDNNFEKLSRISASHIYNLKKTRVYQCRTLEYTKTRPTAVSIGERRKPEPNGIPGYLRVDSVHQGDLDKEKGVYHINIVDEVTQFEYTACVEKISEDFLIPILEELIESYPYKIINFHSDNGSEYINQVVAKLLNKLSINQTKSRSRQTNDNALVEGKNGAVIRKFMGYVHIPKKNAELINEFDRKYLNPFINFHRYSAFPTDIIDERGKVKKKYKDYMTPCQKLLSIPNVENYLKPGITKEFLIKEQNRQTHFESAREMQKAKSKLFARIFPKI